MEPDEARTKAADARRLAEEAESSALRVKWLKVAAAWEELSGAQAAQKAQPTRPPGERDEQA